MDEKNTDKSAITDSQAQKESGCDDFGILPSQMSPADTLALAEKVMALLKRELRVERERLLGR